MLASHNERMTRDMTTRVLVVDDEQVTLSLLTAYLELTGYTAITTADPRAAVELAEIEQPDVIVLDVMMPELDGFTVCKLIRSNAAIRQVPIIFLTAYELIDMEERRIEAGADLVVYKPIDFHDLAAAIEKARASYEQDT
jgi:CheY-like chemotaxis protein